MNREGRSKMDTQLESGPTMTTLGRVAGAAGVAFAALLAWVVASFAVTAVCLATFVGGFVTRALRDDRPDVRLLATIGAFGAMLIGAWFALVLISQLMLLAL